MGRRTEIVSLWHACNIPALKDDSIFIHNCWKADDLKTSSVSNVSCCYTQTKDSCTLTALWDSTYYSTEIRGTQTDRILGMRITYFVSAGSSERHLFNCQNCKGTEYSSLNLKGPFWVFVLCCCRVLLSCNLFSLSIVMCHSLTFKGALA